VPAVQVVGGAEWIFRGIRWKRLSVSYLKLQASTWNRDARGALEFQENPRIDGSTLAPAEVTRANPEPAFGIRRRSRTAGRTVGYASAPVHEIGAGLDA